MKTNVLPITAGVFGSLALAVSASGQFLGALIEEIDLGAPECFVTYRVVAHFGGPDLTLAWGALPDVAELLFFTGNGVNLLNAGGEFEGLKAEDFAAFPISEAYDSWVTVGVTEHKGNNTDYSDGFLGSDGVHAVIVGSSFKGEGLVFNGNPKNPWNGPDVVMAQFTLPEGNGFHLEGMVGWALAGAGAGFESTPFVVDNIIPPPCPWDLDASGSVGASDLLALLASWGPCKGCCPADFDLDGNVGASDLLALLANWGLCP